jgi:uncharacterized protein (DUF4213/DUF364 family)
MTNGEMYKTLKHSFKGILNEYGIREKTVSVKADVLDSAEPNGKEVVLIAEYAGVIGECLTGFVPASAQFAGTLSQVLELDIENNPYERSIYIACVNAVMNKHRHADDCVSCSEDKRDKCAEYIAHHYKKNNGKVNILLVGYHPQILKGLAENFPVRLLDMNPDNIGKTYFNVTAEDGADFADATQWADVILCNGSSLSYGTITSYINLPKDVNFYGTTIAGCARVFQLKRLCPYSKDKL